VNYSIFHLVESAWYWPRISTVNQITLEYMMILNR